MFRVNKSPVKLDPNSNHSAVNLQKHVFNGGTSLDWNLFVARLKASLNSKDCVEFIDISGAVEGVVVEYLPGNPRPCPIGEEDAYVQAQVNQKRAVVSAARATNEGLLNDLYNGLPVTPANTRERQLKTAEVQMKANNDLAAIENQRDAIRRDLDTANHRSDEKDKEFRQRLADCIKIFYAMLGHGPLAVAEPYLRANRTRAAFYALNSHYSAGIGGQQAASMVMHQMQNFPMDLQARTLTENMALMERLNAEFIAGGLNAPLPPAFMLHNFLEALKKATDLYKDEILFIKQGNKSWEEAKLSLQERENHLTVQGISSPARKPRNEREFGSPREFQAMIAKAVTDALLKRNGDETAAAAASPAKKPRALVTCDVCGKQGHSGENCWTKATCPLCKTVGHIAKYCPTVTGKPFTSSPKKTHPAVTIAGAGLDASPAPRASYCSSCGQLAVCEGVLECDSVFGTSYPEADVVREELMAALFDQLCLNALVAQESERRCHRSLRFIVDSGASSHMFPCQTLLRGAIGTVRGSVSLGKSDYKLRIGGQGKTAISALESVLWVPGLSFGLISVSRLDRSGHTTTTEAGKIVIKNKIGEMVLTATLAENGLYYLDDKYLATLWGATTCTCLGGQVTATAKQEQTSSMETSSPGAQELREEGHPVKDLSPGQKLELLHKRLGHPGETIIKKALKNKNYNDAPVEYADVKELHLKFCPSCFEGKMKAESSPDKNRLHKYGLFEKFGIDWKGPFRTQSVNGDVGFYLVADYGSNWTIAYPANTKADEVAHEVLEKYNAVVENAGKKIKVMQCDYDSVLLGGVVEGWLAEKFVRLQSSAPYTHWQNGLIEATMGKVMDKTRSIMADARVPHKFWNYAVHTACYLSNRLPVRHHNKTPYEIRFGRKPTIDHLVPFFCAGLYYVEKALRQGALDRKARRCFCLGYDEMMKDTYWVLDAESGSIYCRKDCVWDEEQVLEGASVNEQNGELNDREIDLVDEEEGEYVMHGPHDEIVPEEDPYWAAPESVNLVERWVQEVRGITVRCLAAQTHIYGAVGEFTIDKLPPIPKTIEEALAGPQGKEWRAALEKELKSFNDRGVFAEAPQEGRAMKVKFVLRVMVKNDYSMKYKVRMVACGYSQIYGLDYKETYAPTASTSAVLVAIQLGAMQGFHFSEFDVTAAFLEGKNDYPNYARLPKILGGIRVLVVGNFYGEKQGPKIWNDQLHGILIRAGFERCPVHACLYKKVKDGRDMWIVVHVDDGLILTNCLEARAEFLKYFNTQVTETTHLELVGRYVGMDFQFYPATRKVLLSHKLYIAQKWGNCKDGEAIPMPATTNLRKAEPNDANPSMLHDCGEFRFMCDRARPDMLVVTGELATGGATSPSDEHLKVAAKAKNYLKSTQDIGLSLGGLGKLLVFGYSDASWVCDGNAKSRLGGCVFLSPDSGSVCSFSRNDTKPSSLSHSSCEAEIKAMDEWCREVLHIMDMIKFLCGPYIDPIKLFVDSESAIELCTSLKQSHKVKHINMRIHFLRELIEDGWLELFFVPTELNVADVLTKALPESPFQKHRRVLLEGHGGVLPRSDERVHLALTATSLLKLFETDL